MENNNLLQQLVERINTHLNLCQEDETPIICGMLSDAQSRSMLVDLVVKKVVDEQFDIPSAIIAINDEFDPNTLD